MSRDRLHRARITGNFPHQSALSPGKGRNEDVNLTGVLQGEEAVWSGTAVRNSKGNFEYEGNIDDQWRVDNELIGYRDHHATFSKNAEFTSAFNPADQSVSGRYR